MCRNAINHQKHIISKRKNKAGNKMLYAGAGTPYILFASAYNVSGKNTIYLHSLPAIWYKILG